MFEYTLTKQKPGVYPDVEQETIEAAVKRLHCQPSCETAEIPGLLSANGTCSGARGTTPDCTGTNEPLITRNVNYGIGYIFMFTKQCLQQCNIANQPPQQKPIMLFS